MAGNDPFSSLETYQLTQRHVQLTSNKLGQGSYASVMEVYYMGLKCAGKKVHEVLLEQGEDSYIVRRFEEECRILSTMRHPNIVQFLGVHFNEGERVPMLVMEFLPMNLTSCIQKHGILPKEIGYSILYDIALGLYYLHNQSPPIVHRDLSANNVLLTYNMDAKISDLGVARILNLTPLQASRLTQTPGTPAYMPPEVMVANPIYNRSIDEFSFGIMMIHIFSGRWPEPECSQIRMEAGKMIPVTEAERRESFLKVIDDDHLLRKAIITCIHNDPSKRMHCSEIVELMSEMVQQFPRYQLDLIEHISRTKQSTQLRPEGEEYKENEGSEQYYDDVIINDNEDKDKLQQVETTPEIQSSVNATDKQPQALLKFPQQFGERSEQVSSKDNSSKSSTLIRLQYDDPKITEVSKPAENISDTSNKRVDAVPRAKSFAEGYVTKPQVLPKPRRQRRDQVETVPRTRSLGDVPKDLPEVLTRHSQEPKNGAARVNSKERTASETSRCESTADSEIYDEPSFVHEFNATKIKQQKLDAYSETNVSRDKITIIGNSTVASSPGHASQLQQPSEQHIYDTDDTDDVSSMVELEPWYFGNIDSTLARTKCKKDGDYLVRYSIDKQRYVVSCRLKNTCHHCIVQQLDSGEYCAGSTASKSLSILIDYLAKFGICLDSSGVVLRNPVNKDDRWAMKCTDFEIVKTMGTSYSHTGQIQEALDKRTNKKIITRSYDGTIPESLNAFLLDVEVLKRCNQSNIASLIGVCAEPNASVTSNPVYIIMEYMPGGIFLQYVQNEVIGRQKTVLCRMCIDIAKGLDYMHTKLSRAHADVAARNCLVGQGAIPLVKVFNLGNSMSFNNSSELKPIPQKYSLPVKWTALETYDYQRHMLSDVWSYGILLWEVFSGGATPYPGMANKIVLSQVRAGYRMDPPRNCPKEISRIMLKCWQVNPNQRPTFSDLISELQAVYSERMNSGIM